MRIYFIFYILVSLLWVVPPSVSAAAVFQAFDADLSLNSSCALVVTYSLQVQPSSISLQNIFKVAVTPIDAQGVLQVNQGVDYPINLFPANGSITNATFTATGFNQYQQYKIQIVEYSTNSQFVAASDAVNIMPSINGCNTSAQTTGGGTVQTQSISPNNSAGVPSTSVVVDIDVQNPISVNSIPDLIQKALEIMIKIGIPLLVVMIVYSGALYLLAMGDPNKIKNAHTMITYTLIGGAILLGAWAIAQLIHSTLIDLTASLLKIFV